MAIGRCSNGHVLPAPEAACRVCGAAVSPEARGPDGAPLTPVAQYMPSAQPGYAPQQQPGYAPPQQAGYAYPPPQPAYAPPGYAPYAPPPKKGGAKKVLTIIGLGVAILIFGTFACGAVIGVSVGKEIGPARDAGVAFGNALLSGDTESTWNMLHPLFQQKYGREGWVELVGQMSSPGSTASFNNVHVNKGTNGTIAEMSGPVTYRGESTTFEVVLRKEGDRWLVLGTHIG